MKTMIACLFVSLADVGMAGVEILFGNTSATAFAFKTWIISGLNSQTQIGTGVNAIGTSSCIIDGERADKAEGMVCTEWRKIN